MAKFTSIKSAMVSLSYAKVCLAWTAQHQKRFMKELLNSAATKNEKLDLLDLAKDYAYCPKDFLNEETCTNNDAMGGKFKVLKWARAHGCP